MKYILSPIPTAVSYGFLPAHHRRAGDTLVLNETEVSSPPLLTGDLQTRTDTLQGTLFGSADELKRHIAHE